jgi:hypothetical protein
MGIALRALESFGAPAAVFCRAQHRRPALLVVIAAAFRTSVLQRPALLLLIVLALSNSASTRQCTSCSASISHISSAQ